MLPIQKSSSIAFGHLDILGIPQFGSVVPGGCITVYVEGELILVDYDIVTVNPHFNQLDAYGSPTDYRGHMFMVKATSKNYQCNYKIQRLTDGCYEDPMHKIITQQATVFSL